MQRKGKEQKGPETHATFAHGSNREWKCEQTSETCSPSLWRRRLEASVRVTRACLLRAPVADASNSQDWTSRLQHTTRHGRDQRMRLATALLLCRFCRLRYFEGFGRATKVRAATLSLIESLAGDNAVYLCSSC